MIYSKSLYDDSQMESDITIVTQVNHFMEVISHAQYINPVDYYKSIIPVGWLGWWLYHLDNCPYVMDLMSWIISPF